MANTGGEFLRRFGNSAIHRLGQIQLEAAVKGIRAAGLKSANAAYFQAALLGYTVFAATKHLALPKSWATWTINTVRLRLIRLAGMVARGKGEVRAKRGKLVFVNSH